MQVGGGVPVGDAQAHLPYGGGVRVHRELSDEPQVDVHDVLRGGGVEGDKEVLAPGLGALEAVAVEQRGLAGKAALGG